MPQLVDGGVVRVLVPRPQRRTPPSPARTFVVAVAMGAGIALGVAACNTDLPIPGGEQTAPSTPAQSGLQSGLLGLQSGQSGQSGMLSQSGAVPGDGQADEFTATPGQLTIALSETPNWPWVVGEPQQCLGFDAALACAIAEEMGFEPDQIVWTSSTFAQAISASDPDQWDMNVQHVAFTSQRDTVVDFSVPYASVPKAVVTTNTSTLRFAPSIAFLHSALFGVVADSTSQSIINDIIRPENAPLAFNTLEDTKQALEQGVVDAVVADVPTAQQIVDEFPEAFMIGRLPETVAADQLAVSLPQGSQLTPFVSAAIRTLQEDGTIQQIQDRWLPEDEFIQTLE